MESTILQLMIENNRLKREGDALIEKNEEQAGNISWLRTEVARLKREGDASVALLDEHIETMRKDTNRMVKLSVEAIRLKRELQRERHATMAADEENAALRKQVASFVASESAGPQYDDFVDTGAHKDSDYWMYMWGS